MNPTTTASSGQASESPEQSESASAEPPEPISGSHPAAASIHLANRTSTHVDTAWLQETVTAALPLLNQPVSRVDVRLLEDTAMAALHQQYHGDNQPTDVLTFDASPTAHAAREVDIAVCVDVAHRCAKDHDHRLERELLLYILHGLLHCTGFDDHTEEGFEAMHAEEDRILDAIGVGRTFAVVRTMRQSPKKLRGHAN